MQNLTRTLALAACVALAGCAGTVKRDADTHSSSLKEATYQSVEVVMTDGATKALVDSPQFSARELGEAVQRRMATAGLIKADATHRMEIVVEGFYVRPMITAVLLSFVAGSDSIDGYVRVRDAAGRQLHGFKVSATYSFGGVAGSLDSMRMAWMYDKFSDLTIDELTGKVTPP